MRLSALLAAAFLGALTGAFLVQSTDRARLAYWVEQTRLARVNATRLQQESSRLREQLALLAARPPGAAVIERAEIRTVGPAPDLPDLRNALEPVTASIIGAAPDRIPFDVVWSLFQHRVIAIRGQWYRIDLKGVVLARTTVIIVATVRVPPPR
ncbi:MAG: hypothetical protein ACP5QO_13170 [Clostridia bacterium]